MSEMRDKLRAAVMGSGNSNLAKEIIEFNGVEFEVREPTVKARKKIFKRAKVKDAPGAAETFDLVMHAAIACTYVPGTDELVLDMSDQEAIDNMRCGGLIDELGAAALKLMNVEAEDKIKN